MARVTVEDCVLTVPNRFELVLLAAKRAREIAAGAPLTITRDNDKNAVVSLREISECTIDLAQLREKLISGMQRLIPGQDAFVDDQSDDSDDDSVLDGPVLETEALLGDLNIITPDDFQDNLDESF